MIHDMLQDPVTWVAFSTVIFAVLALKLAGRKTVAALDAQIAVIRDEIETAEKLRADAQKLLADYKARQADAQAEAARIIEQAKASARVIQQGAQAELEEAMARREAQLVDRLKRVEEKALADIQNHAAELALKAAHEIVTKSVTEKTNASLVDQAIAAVAKNLN